MTEGKCRSVCYTFIAKSRGFKGSSLQDYRGVPTERWFLAIWGSVAIKKNNLKPLHSGNTYPLRFLYFRCKTKRLKYLQWLFDQDLTCLIFPFRWACFPIKIGQNAQWEHLFSMDFDDFLTINLILLV